MVGTGENYYCKGIIKIKTYQAMYLHQTQLTMETQIELDSFSSMIVTNLPLPPLPIRALRGEDNEDSFCSSHDLLARAIACNLRDGSSNGEEVQKRKQQILLDLNTRIVAVWQDKEFTQAERVAMGYTIFADIFRQYFALYPGSFDLRVMPIQDVDPKSVVFQQAVEHLKAQNVFITDDDEVVKFSKTYYAYDDIIHAYMYNLWKDRKR